MSDWQQEPPAPERMSGFDRGKWLCPNCVIRIKLRALGMLNHGSSPQAGMLFALVGNSFHCSCHERGVHVSLEVPRLLISDDDPLLRETLQSLFEREGFAVSVAGDGHQAWQMVVSRTVHLVLSDVNMPGLNGLELVRATRQYGLPVPFVFLTADVSSELLNEATRWQVQRVLAKPVSPQSVRQAVRDALASAPELYWRLRGGRPWC